MPSQYTRAGSRSVSTRITHAQHAALQRFLAPKGISASGYLRCVTLALADNDREAALCMLEDAAKALGIDIRNMSEGEMVRKIADLFDEIAIEDDAADDPAGDDPPAELSRKELAACKARGIAPEDFVQMKAEAARRVAPSKITKPAPAGPNAISQKEIAACRARGIDPKDFAARKAAAVRRV